MFRHLCGILKANFAVESRVFPALDSIDKISVFGRIFYSQIRGVLPIYIGISNAYYYT